MVSDVGVGVSGGGSSEYQQGNRFLVRWTACTRCSVRPRVSLTEKDDGSGNLKLPEHPLTVSLQSLSLTHALYLLLSLGHD